VVFCPAKITALEKDVNLTLLNSDKRRKSPSFDDNAEDDMFHVEHCMINTVEDLSVDGGRLRMAVFFN